MTNVLERDNWKTDVDFMISDIVEYDMRRGGMSIIKEKNLLPQDEIKKLESMEKRVADMKIGKMERKNKELSKGKQAGFKEYRLKFGVANELTNDDIVSVKKDAIFVKHYCYHTKFDTYVEFREKNHYEAYLQLKEFEFYWNSEGLDVKGLHDDNVPFHKEYMLKFIHTYMKYLAQYDEDGARKYIVRFIDDYKFRKLPIGFYREFNSSSSYYIDLGNDLLELKEVGLEYISQIYIEYNFINILVPLLNFVI